MRYMSIIIHYINITYFTGRHCRKSPRGNIVDRGGGKNRKKWENICGIHICWYIGIKFGKVVAHILNYINITGWQCFPRGCNLQCPPVKNVIFILLYRMSHFYNKISPFGTLPCDIQNCHLANWQIRLLQINMRYNKYICTTMRQGLMIWHVIWL